MKTCFPLTRIPASFTQRATRRTPAKRHVPDSIEFEISNFKSAIPSGLTSRFRDANAHELTSVDSTSQTFDDDGNLTAGHTGVGLSWNDANRASGSTLGSLTTTYKYDADGKRASKKVVDGTTTTEDKVFVYAGPNCVAEYNYGAASSAPVMEYIYAGEIDSLAMIARNNNAEKLIATRNQQWSIVSLCDNANGNVLERYTYDQFGKRKILAADGSTVRTSSSYDNPYGYTSRRHDAESGLMYFRARYYDPTTGEFTSRDPLEYVDGMSLYRGYMGIDNTDPFGLCNDVTHRECELAAWDARKEWQTMIDQIVHMGCDMIFSECLRCGGDSWGDAAAKYFPKTKDKRAHIKICFNRLDDPEDVKTAFWHELVHAYDDCKFKLDDNCTKLACTEVRAYSYSIQCNSRNGEPLSEDDRKTCVKDLAIRSTKFVCPDTAENDVNRVFEKCYLTQDQYNSHWLHHYDDHWMNK